MPLYEYICSACSRKFTWLVGVVAGTTAPICDRCGAQVAVRKEVSRFARLRSEEDSLDALAGPESIGELDDPATMRKWAKEVGSEMGEGLGDEFDEYIDTASAGGDVV